MLVISVERIYELNQDTGNEDRTALTEWFCNAQQDTRTTNLRRPAAR